jgi:hypothetical protein
MKTTMKFHFTPLRMANIKITNTKNASEYMRGKGTHIHCWWECKLGQLLWKLVRMIKKIDPK